MHQVIRNGRRLWLPVCLAVSLLAAACGGPAAGGGPTGGGAPAASAPASGGSKPAPAAPAATIRVAVARSLAGSVFYGMQPFAEKQGIKIEPITAANNAEMQRDMQQNAVEAADIGYQNVASLADQGITDMKVVAGAFRNGQNLETRKGANIKTWADLKGKKIGIVQGSYAAILFLIAARENGVDPSGINLVNVTPAGTTEIQAMKSGQLDGYVIWSPTLEKAIIQGVAERPSGIDIETAPSMKDGTGIIAVTPKFMQDSANLSKFLKAYVDTIDYYNQHLDEWAKLAAQFTGADADSLALAVKNEFLDYKVVRASLIGTAKHGPEFGYTKADMSGKVEALVDLGPLGTVLGVDPNTLWE